jgi:hypothetical protein
MTDYKFRTTPFAHQEAAFLKYRDRPFHAHLHEQRTGKSKVSIDTAAWLYQQGKITGLLVIAPNGIHLNWNRAEIPTHMPEHIGCDPVTWHSSPNAEQRRALEKLTKGTGLGLRCLSMNIEALRGEKARDFVRQYLNAFRCLLVLDEGSIIKNVSAGQTKEMLKLKKLAPFRRLLNGTPLTQSPLDLFPQFNFLDESILGSSHVSFRNRYAVVEMQGRMKYEVKKRLDIIAGQLGTYCWGDLQHSECQGFVEAGLQPVAEQPSIEFTVKQAGLSSYAMVWRSGVKVGQETLRFEQGQVYPVITGYRYLDELKERIAPYSDRVLKADCLDLPDKIYSKRFVELSDQQAKMYKELKKDCLTMIGKHQMSASLAITKMLRLQQIVGGFFVPDIVQHGLPDGSGWDLEEMEVASASQLDIGALPIPGPNPRIEALLSDIESGLTGKGIIWARFTAEIKLIAKTLREKYGAESVAELYGQVDSAQRQNAIDHFQLAGSGLRFIICNPQCKGVSRGQNMCQADWEWYYSNSFSLEDRLQSEDRPHSPGQNNNLSVIDAVCTGTLDEYVIEALRGKKDLANQVTGDAISTWI